MMHNAAGETTLVERDDALSTSNWHSLLDDKQFAAYVRYQYIRYSTDVIDWESPAHTRRRANWDGGADAFGVNHSNVWRQIGNAIRSRNVDPGLWVAAHFVPGADQKNTSGAFAIPEIRPRSLISGRSDHIYNNYCDMLPNTIANEFSLAGNTIALRYKAIEQLKLSPDDGALFVLCDEEYVNASPFFRHAFAARANCEEAVERFLWRAALDYEVKQKYYDHAIEIKKVEPWVVTDCLLGAVQEIRSYWLGGHSNE